MKRASLTLLLALSAFVSPLLAKPNGPNDPKEGNWTALIGEGRIITSVLNFYLDKNKEIYGWSLDPKTLKISRLRGNIRDGFRGITLLTREGNQEKSSRGFMSRARTFNYTFTAGFKSGKVMKATRISGKIDSAGAYLGYWSAGLPILLIVRPDGSGTFHFADGFSKFYLRMPVTATKDTVKVHGQKYGIKMDIEVHGKRISGDGSINGQRIRLFGNYISLEAR